jgi:hypothetical protein
MTQKMDAKKLFVSFMAIASILVLVASVSASNLASNVQVEVEGINAAANDVAIVAGETITVKVYFESDVNTSDVTVEAELDGKDIDVEAKTTKFDVETGKTYRKTLTLKVPSELKDQLSDDVTLTIKVDGDDAETEREYELRIQRDAYTAAIRNVVVDQSVDAGETFPVDVVLQNIGYNNLDNVYVIVSIPTLGVSKTAYFGDIVALECDDDDDAVENYGVDVDRKCNEDDEDTTVGRLFLQVPYGVDAGSYALEVKVESDEMTSTMSKQLNVVNDFANEVVVSGTSRTVAVGEDAEYELLIVNPTDKVKVYRIVTESSGDLSSSAETTLVAVPAGSSKNIKVVASADEEGEYTFNANVFSGNELIETVALKASVEGKSAVTNPIVILTVILAIVFVVLLIVLIVLIARKPERSEEFGESYY